MLSVLIADDEKKVGLLIKNLIEWERLGLRFLDLVQDGQSAYDMILRERPDIVITDIRMPQLSGLEMIEKVLTKGVNPHFIVVSGYRYFEYAQRALKYGVKDYLLKPIDEIELNKILEKVCTEEMQKRNLENKVETLEKNLFHSRHMLHKELMERVFRETEESKETEEALQAEEENSGNGRFLAVALKVDRDIARERNAEQEQLILQKLSEKAEESLKALTIDLVVSGKSGMWMMILLNFREENSVKVIDALDSMFFKMRNYISGFEGCDITMGRSPKIEEFSKINLILEMAREAAERRIFEGCGKCIEKYTDESCAESASEGYADILSCCREQLKESISIFRTEEVGDIVKRCFQEAKRLRLMASEYYGLAHNLLAEYTDILMELFQKETEEVTKWHEVIGHCRTTASLCQYIEDTMGGHLAKFEKSKRESERKPILNAIRYVQQNYGQKILLEDIADMSGFNANYFSEIFKKETGKTFTTFLLEVRIEASKTMLRDTTKTIYEIASDVGYKDSKFFSQQFTKIVGIKPKEYRRLYY